MRPRPRRQLPALDIQWMVCEGAPIRLFVNMTGIGQCSHHPLTITILAGGWCNFKNRNGGYSRRLFTWAIRWKFKYYAHGGIRIVHQTSQLIRDMQNNWYNTKIQKSQRKGTGLILGRFCFFKRRLIIVRNYINLCVVWSPLHFWGQLCWRSQKRNICLDVDFHSTIKTFVRVTVMDFY